MIKPLRYMLAAALLNQTELPNPTFRVLISLSSFLLLLGIFLAVVGLLVLRMFAIFPQIACVHCRAKNICPNAQAMGLSNK